MSSKPFELTDKQKAQRDLAASAFRHILAFGGGRSGKTFGFCYCISKRAIMAPKSRHLIARLHNVDTRQAVMMDTWPTMMRLANPGIRYELNKSDQVAYFDNDAEVWFGGLDDNERVDKILGKEYATIYPGECSQIAYSTILTLRTRLAQVVEKTDGRPLMQKAYYDLNPVGMSHWSYLEFILGVRPENRQPFKRKTRAHIIINPEDNPHLSSDYLHELDDLPERQRLRFKEGKYLSEVPGTLWPMDNIENSRRDEAPDLERIVVGVDPSGSDGTSGDCQGIIVSGKGVDGHMYVLEDGSARLSPAGWGKRACDLYHKWGADAIVAEANFGGAMVKETILGQDKKVNVKLVSASRGKHIRAEPIASLYEKSGSREPMVHHVGRFPDLEEQMTSFTSDGYQGAGSPDRADALVWTGAELMMDQPVVAQVFLSKRTRKRLKGAA